jgi:hypothetical protein
VSLAFSWLRLSFRAQRLELLLLAATVLAISGLMGWFAIQLNDVAESNPDCDFLQPAEACLSAGTSFSSIFDLAELALMSTSVITLGVGLFLGVPLVSREVEQGTAQLAWTISRSRLRWLLGRAAFAVLIGILLLGILALATDVLAAAMRPDLDTWQAFWFYGGRGPILIGRGVLALGAGLLIGAVVGRQLAALLLATLVVGALIFATEVAFRAWHETEAVGVPLNEVLGDQPLGIGSGVQLPSGEVVPYSAVRAEFQDESGALYATQEDLLARRNPLGRQHYLIIPGERYPRLIARETSLLAGAGILLIGSTAAAIRHRRPT